MTEPPTPPPSRINGRSTCWPTAEQTLLLKACLLDGEHALNAWREWDGLVDVDELDSGSYRLLPLLYRNLSRLEVHPDYLGRLKGCYRLSWFKNNMLQHRVHEMLALLRAHDIESLSLKGFPLAIAYYRDIGLRPMDDFDFLVRPEKAATVITLLLEQGWKPEFTFESPESIVGLRHSMGFSRGQFENCDLHWHALAEISKESLDAYFWEQSVQFDFKGQPCRTLCATDHLLHAVLHGVKWNAIPPLRWIADACVIMHESAIDWQRFLTMARLCRAELPLLDGLALLRTTLGREVPSEVFKALKERTPSQREVKAYRELISQPDLENPGSLLRLNYQRYCKSRGDAPATLLDFPRYLQWKWQLDNLWQVPFVALFKTVRSLKRRLT